jgi:hypothetical protein
MRSVFDAVRRTAATWRLLVGLAALAMASGSAAGHAADDPGSPASTSEIVITPVTPPPEEVVAALRLSPFYRKHVGVGEFSVVSSDQVADAALLEAAWLIRRMLSHRPEILAALAKNRVRFVVMGVGELTTDVPEHSDLTPKDYWDKRARGLGASRRRPAVSCGEENLLCYRGDPYSTENILVHEFGHAIHGMGLSVVDPTFDERLKVVYDQALQAGLWEGTYAATNRQEYWAEGVQSWFDTNREGDSEHNRINTRAELREYDAGLAKLLVEVFGDGDWRYTRPSARRDLPHLAGFDVSQAPRFAWPESLVRRHEAFRRAARGEPLDGDDWPDAAPLPLPDLGSIRSENSAAAATLLVVNRRPQPVRIDWIDFDGRRNSMGTVAANDHRVISTYQTHVWLVSDGEDRPLGLFQCGRPQERYVLTP